MKKSIASIVTVTAVCTLIAISNASASPGQLFARYGRHVESSEGPAFNGKTKQQQNARAKSEQLQAFKYPRYKLVDLGTLGGPNASQISPGVL